MTYTTPLYDQYEREEEKQNRIKYETIRSFATKFIENQTSVESGISEIVDKEFENLLL